MPPVKTCSGVMGAHKTIGRGGLGLVYRHRIGKAVLSESTGGQLTSAAENRQRVEQSPKRPAGQGDAHSRVALLRTERTVLLHK